MPSPPANCTFIDLLSEAQTHGELIRPATQIDPRFESRPCEFGAQIGSGALIAHFPTGAQDVTGKPEACEHHGAGLAAGRHIPLAKNGVPVLESPDSL